MSTSFIMQKNCKKRGLGLYGFHSSLNCPHSLITKDDWPNHLKRVLKIYSYPDADQCPKLFSLTCFGKIPAYEPEVFLAPSFSPYYTSPMSFDRPPAGPDCREKSPDTTQGMVKIETENTVYLLKTIMYISIM